MKLKNTLFAAAATLGLIAQPVWAQSTSDSRSVEARANVVSSQLTLAIAELSTLEFGTVRIPNGTAANAQCRYTLNLLGAPVQGTMALAEVRNGSVFDNTFPTPSGCESSGATSPAQFVVGCTPAVPVTFSAQWTTQGGIPGVALGNSGQAVMTFANSNAVRGSATNVGTATVFTCPDGSSGEVVGGFVVNVGGSVTLDTNASPFNGTIGTVTLNATY